MKRLAVFSAAALLVLGAASRTFAEPPGASSAPGVSSAPGERERLERQRERILEQLRARGLALPSGSATPAAPSGSGAPPAAPSSSAAPLDAAAELARRWQALAESRAERRERHRAALVRELGQRLSDPRVKDELKLHATRVAELGRLQFLAENARSGAARDKLLARIVKLTAREEARHQKALTRLAAPAAAPSAAPSAKPRPQSGAH